MPIAGLQKDPASSLTYCFFSPFAACESPPQPDIANPDQRIAEDVRVFTASTLSLMLVLLNTTFTILAFAGVMWSISPLLFGTAVAYAALGSALTVIFGRPLIWLNYNQADREASLRADLVHLRENAESVAVHQREGRVGARLVRRLDELVANTKRIIAVNRNLGFFTTATTTSSRSSRC